jgi:hypothetical protein
MKKIIVSLLATLMLFVFSTGAALAAEKIKLFDQFYQNGNFRIGMLKPVDEEFNRYKPKEMKEDMFRHVSKIGDIELMAVYLNYYRSPEAGSFWDQGKDERNAIISALISAKVPMNVDYAFTKILEKDSENPKYNQKDILYKVYAEKREWIYAFRFIRSGGDEYVLAYKGPKDTENLLSPDEFFNTFKLLK